MLRFAFLENPATVGRGPLRSEWRQRPPLSPQNRPEIFSSDYPPVQGCTTSSAGTSGRLCISIRCCGNGTSGFRLALFCLGSCVSAMPHPKSTTRRNATQPNDSRPQFTKHVAKLRSGQRDGFGDGFVLASGVSSDSHRKKQTNKKQNSAATSGIHKNAHRVCVAIHCW